VDIGARGNPRNRLSSKRGGQLTAMVNAPPGTYKWSGWTPLMKRALPSIRE